MDSAVLKFIHDNQHKSTVLRSESVSKDKIFYLKIRYCPDRSIVPSQSDHVSLSHMMPVLDDGTASQVSPAVIRSSRLLSTMSMTYRYKITMIVTGMVSPSNWAKQMAENVFMHDLFRAFGMPKKYKCKKFSSQKHIKPVLAMFAFRGAHFPTFPLHFIPNLELKQLETETEKRLVLNFDFGFYCNDVDCIHQFLFKLFYKYRFQLFSCDVNGRECIENIHEILLEDRKQQLLTISDEIVFSKPNKLLRYGGIEYQAAHETYEQTHHHQHSHPHIFEPDELTFRFEVKKIGTFRKIFLRLTGLFSS